MYRLSIAKADAVDELAIAFFGETSEHGLVLAHQNLGQFDRDLLASTAIKIVGGMSAKDASFFAKEMRVEPDFLQDMRKHQKHTEFACWIRNTTERVEFAYSKLHQKNLTPQSICVYAARN